MHLVSDIERIREHLGIESWVVSAGRGAARSPGLAQTHPARTRALVLRGIFLCRPKEIQWFYQEGASAIYPDAWEHYVKVIPEAERTDMLGAFHRRLTSDDEAVRLEAASAWSIWEGSTSKLYPDQDFIAHYADPQFALAFARIECHYFMNNAFFDTDNYLIENVGKIRTSRRSSCRALRCGVPLMSAWELHRAWPEADCRSFRRGTLRARTRHAQRAHRSHDRFKKVTSDR